MLKCVEVPRIEIFKNLKLNRVKQPMSNFLILALHSTKKQNEVFPKYDNQAF